MPTWIKDTLRQAMRRDPVKAANALMSAANLMETRAHSILAEHVVTARPLSEYYDR